MTMSKHLYPEHYPAKSDIIFHRSAGDILYYPWFAAGLQPLTGRCQQINILFPVVAMYNRCTAKPRARWACVDCVESIEWESHSVRLMELVSDVPGLRIYIDSGYSEPCLLVSAGAASGTAKQIKEFWLTRMFIPQRLVARCFFHTPPKTGTL